MFMQNLYIPLAMLCATIMLMVEDAPAQQKHLVPHPDHHVLTFQPTKHTKLALQSIESIHNTMQTHTPLTPETGVAIDHATYAVKSGISIKKQNSVVFLFVRGFEPKPCAARAATLYEEHIVPADCPLIGFDFNDNRQQFSFGQEKDISTLKQVYEEILRQNQSARIVLIGNCNGAKVALEFATQRPKQLKALILLTPFVSARAVLNRISESYLFNLPLAAPLIRFTFCAFTAYDPSKDTLEDRLIFIDTQIPIFIGQRVHDAVVPDHEVKQLAHTLHRHGNQVDTFFLEDTSKRHNNLLYHPLMQYRIARFLRHAHLPYNKKAIALAYPMSTGE